MIAVPFLRTPFNYDRDEASIDTGLECKDVTRAVQHLRDEADINKLVERFGLTQTMPQLAEGQRAIYGNFEGVPFDYQTAMNAIIEADRSFMAIPPAVRARFHNNPDELIKFLSDESLKDEKNFDEAVRLNLINPRQDTSGGLPPSGSNVEDKPK